jgi:hypothetical protein
MGDEHTAIETRPPRRTRRISVTAILDEFFFVYAGLAAIWLAWLLLTESFKLGWLGIAFFLVFWVMLAYLALPRLHRIFTAIYVPDYFIGRTRTSDGLLGDPVNLAVPGSDAHLREAMARAGWTLADPVTMGSAWKIVTSTIARRSYDRAPVSPLLLFGRVQDMAYQQEVAGNPAKRHHVRFGGRPMTGCCPVARASTGSLPVPSTGPSGFRCSPCRSPTRSMPTSTWSVITSWPR